MFWTTATVTECRVTIFMVTFERTLLYAKSTPKQKIVFVWIQFGLEKRSGSYNAPNSTHNTGKTYRGHQFLLGSYNVFLTAFTNSKT